MVLRYEKPNSLYPDTKENPKLFFTFQKINNYENKNYFVRIYSYFIRFICY